MSREFKVGFALLISLGVIYCGYLPAIPGPFIFDDFANLNYLAIFEFPITTDQILHYLTLGHAGPTGRPISLLSFLLDAQSWPADAAPFKKTNLLFHLVNMLLVFWCITLILELTPYKNQKCWIALLASTCWGINPYLVSTVAYPVQRMTILSAFFSLLSIVLYLKLRYVHYRYEHQSQIRIYLLVLLLVSIVIGTTFSFFSKENGALTPVFLLLIEYFFIAKVRPMNVYWHRLLLKILLWGATIAIVYKLLVTGYAHWNEDVLSRNYSVGERLMTQTRMIWFYLWNLFVPSTGYPGVYIEPIEVSRALIKPISTLTSFLLLSISLISVWFYRKRYPLFVFSFLFFVCGHLVESTTVMLELYFEHRNYLPSIFLWLAPAAWFIGLSSKKKPLLVIPLVYLVCQISVLVLLTNIWGSEKKLRTHWADINTGSVRALSSAALYLSDNGYYQEAIYYARKGLNVRGGTPNGMLLNLYVDCKLRVSPNIFSPVFYEKLNTSLSDTHYTLETFNYLDNLFVYHRHTHCEQLSFEILLSMVNAYENSEMGGVGTRLGPILHLKGKVLLELNRPQEALRYFLQSFHVWKSMDTAMTQVAALGNKGFFKEAEKMLIKIENCNEDHECKSQLKILKDYSDDLEYLRLLLTDDLEHQRNER